MATLALAVQIFQHLLPANPEIQRTYVWHNDLHDENMFVDAQDPTRIVGIIDWQSTTVSPLFEHNIDPAILSYDGSRPESLEKPVLPPNFQTLSAEEKVALTKLRSSKALLIAYRRLIQKHPSLQSAITFQDTSAYDVLNISRRVFEVGEAHVQAVIAGLNAEWRDISQLCQTSTTTTCPIVFSEDDLARIEKDVEAAEVGMHTMNDVKERLGILWPEKGVVQHQYYEETKALLREAKAEIISVLELDDVDIKIFDELWPFDD